MEFYRYRGLYCKTYRDIFPRIYDYCSNNTGIIYGLFFYKRKVGIVKLSIVEIIRTLIVGMILNTWFLTMITGLPFNVLLFSRIVKELVMIPINVALIYLIFKLFKKNYEL